MKKEDIILKKGDKVYYTNNNNGDKDDFYVYSSAGHTIKELEERDNYKVIKVERCVSYKTIYEAPKEILDKEEKEYLEAVVRPFKDSVEFIEKKNSCCETEKQYIWMSLTNEFFTLPNFDRNTMYKGMEINKHYTLEELGLFEG